MTTRSGKTFGPYLPPKPQSGPVGIHISSFIFSLFVLILILIHHHTDQIILPFKAWSGACDVDKFIGISKAGKKNGVFILHRECGTLVELGAAVPVNAPGEECHRTLDVEGDVEPASATTPDTPLGRPVTAGQFRSVRRAIGKMKATITQRFVNAENGTSFDIDCDCRFIFFLEKVVEVSPVAGTAAESTTAAAPIPRWRTVYVKLFYEKDKIVPVDGHSAPRFTAEERQYMQDSLPEGYRYLGTMQRRLGYAIDEKLPTPRNAGWERMYSAMEAWLGGRKATLG